MDRTLTWVGVDPEARLEDPTGERYLDQGLLGVGGMGEVRQVRDTWFDTTVAMKILSPALAQREDARAAFVLEGQRLARLRHPGVVAVLDRGEHPDGRLWYTMTEVTGGTLLEVDRALQLGVLERVANVLAYAHSEGVVHRDVKAENIMFGAFDEVYLMDWGISAQAGADVGMAGTPRTMAPEQARGEPAMPAMDVYALGVTLHEVLTGEPLLQARGPAALHALRTNPPRFTGRDDLPSALQELVRRSTAPEPEERPSALEVATALNEWRSGVTRAREALELLDATKTLAQRAKTLRRRSADARNDAHALEAELLPTHPEEAWHPVWALEEQAEALARDASVLEARWLGDVNAALNLDPDCGPAHEALAEHWAGRLLDAERTGEPTDALVVHLGRHDRGRYADLLKGDGRVTLVTDPPGAQVRAFRYVERHRRLVPQYVRDLGVTPLAGVMLERGSWVLELEHPDCEPVRYPVFLGRGEAWDGCPPGASEPAPVRLPQRGSLADGEIWVPPGWFWCGAREGVEPFAPHRRWLDAYVIGRRHVTVREYIAFLDTLGPDAEPHVPRLSEFGPLLERRSGRWSPVALTDEPSLALDHPIVAITHHSASAYAAFAGARLPTELEWEKAARGVDGRAHPWGRHLHARWANLLNGGDEPASLVPAGTYPQDCSPYGVLDCAGNAMDWCANGWSDDPAVLPPADPEGLAVGRGATKASGGAHLASRWASPTGSRWRWTSFRLGRDAPR